MSSLLPTEEEPDLGYEGLEVLLPFLEDFERPGYTHGTWVDLQGGWRGFDFAPPTEAFFTALYDRGIVYPFDWAEWQEEGVRLHEDPEALGRANAPTLRKLLTLHARKDHFAEGHLASVLESGHITDILRRIRTLSLNGESLC